MNIIRAPIINYAEISQTSDTKFSFLHEETDHFIELFSPVKCRDFLGDCISAQSTGNYGSIYNFTPPKKLDKDKTKLLISSERGIELYNIDKNLSYLTNIELKNKFNTSFILGVKEGLIIIGDSRWMSNVATISIYSYLLRTLSYNNPTKIKTGNEADYKKRIGDNYQLLLDNIYKIAIPVQNGTGWENDSIHCAHNSSGFVSLFSSKKNNNTLSKLFFEEITNNEPLQSM